jgi:glycosyltransferase involved in cell wall biosynthesis
VPPFPIPSIEPAWRSFAGHNAPVKIAAVHDWLVNPGGSEEVLREVLSLYQCVLFTSQCNRSLFPWLEGVEVRTSCIQRLPFSLTKHALYAPLASWAYPRFDLSEYDVVLSDSHSFAHGVKKRADALHVNYFHTPPRSLWLPEIDRRASGLLARLIVGTLKKRDLAASRRPDVLFANSKTTAERIRRFYGREVSQVIYPPVHTETFRKVERRADDEGFLIWGRLVHYKRVDLAIEAARITGVRLNVVGSGPLEATLKEQAERLPNVRFHGRLPMERLLELLSRSKAVLFPAYEDFGIVPVEAMAAGVPVAAYAMGGAAESITPETGVLMREQSPECLADAIRELQRRSFDEKTIRARAAQFDVEVFREQYKRAVDAELQARGLGA